ncbi:MAG: succinate dehydrogenase/fumarate reductase iron-sulfur subunit [Nitrospira sp.]|nr:succinate dehydrogenase/fumarate reductase iron-sulfur subunit [Nitrospira sp.]MDH4251507.1 succinate dehydrogenase/fumarate reductase iron-sulfur subunit [Nitrospira sp.]MDH4342120.1 succinate dehydrogenase/fumarate reductase iron-sulfur subunit [Nitrospira sp.]MDH5335441.1 succinate dehydrogenase/fumarate reductase iron-sulfur subunit [Nitrospira sp.]
MTFTLKIWRQKSPDEKGRFVTYKAHDVGSGMSFLEMLDGVNQGLIAKGEEPVAFEQDCREGICGSCSLVINGIPHGPDRGMSTCQLYMRRFPDGAAITIEPWRARAFPIIKDLVVDRRALDRVMQAGGYVSVNTGGAVDGNVLLIEKDQAETAMDAASCIGCGACVAACKNASAMLFVAAKVSHLALLPQGKPERTRRVKTMLDAMDREGFGSCGNQYECEAVCPKRISVRFIATLNREYLRAGVVESGLPAEPESPHAESA